MAGLTQSQQLLKAADVGPSTTPSRLVDTVTAALAQRAGDARAVRHPAAGHPAQARRRPRARHVPGVGVQRPRRAAHRGAVRAEPVLDLPRDRLPGRACRAGARGGVPAERARRRAVRALLPVPAHRRAGDPRPGAPHRARRRHPARADGRAHRVRRDASGRDARPAGGEHRRAAVRRAPRPSACRSRATTTWPGSARSFNEMAASLQEQIRQLEDLSRVQRRFVSDVSHELRTPLTTVRMAADVLHEARDDFDPAAARSAELLQNQLDRFEALLADLLEISRFDAGAAVLEAEPVDLRDARRRAADVRGAARRAARHRDRARAAARAGARRRGPAPDRADPAQPARATRSSTARAQPVTVTVAADAQGVGRRVRDHGVGLRPGRGRRWSSTGSGAPTRPGPAPPAAPGSGCRSRWRTPGCTAAGCRPGGHPARAPTCA